MKASKIFLVMAATVAAATLGGCGSAGAVEKTDSLETVTICDLEGIEDLEVSFEFDSEVVDITLISPDGEEITENSGEVEITTDGLTATYFVSDADAGTWCASYDLGSNKEVDFTVLNRDEKLLIDDMNLSENEDGTFTVSFNTDYIEGDVEYNYEIELTGTENDYTLDEGRAESGVEENVVVDLSDIPSGKYRMKLSVSYDGGETELTDSLSSNSFEYVNENEASK